MELVKTFQTADQTVEYLEKHLKKLFEDEDIGAAYERYTASIKSRYLGDDLIDAYCLRLTQGGSKVEVLSKGNNEWKLKITSRGDE